MSLKVAIVGCGGVSKGSHLPAWQKVPEVELVGICDLVKEKADEMASLAGTKPYYSIEDLLAHQDPEIIDACVNEKVRREVVVQCLQADVHVFTEKPLAGAQGQANIRPSDLPLGKEMVQAAERTGKSLGINFNYRFAPHAMKLKELIDQGATGEPVAINVFAHLACWSHVIDLMRWFNGEVGSLCAALAGPEQGPDRSASLRFRNGSLGTLVGTNRIGWLHPLLRMEYVGTEERVVISDLCGSIERFPVHRNEVIAWSQPVTAWRSDFQTTFERSIAAFAESVRSGEPPPVSGWDGLRELEIDAAIFESAETGGWVEPIKYPDRPFRSHD